MNPQPPNPSNARAARIAALTDAHRRALVGVYLTASVAALPPGVLSALMGDVASGGGMGRIKWKVAHFAVLRYDWGTGMAVVYDDRRVVHCGLPCSEKFYAASE